MFCVKKIFSIILSLVLLVSLTIPVSAHGSESKNLAIISEVFGIPVSILETLDADTQTSLLADATNNRLVSSAETYVKITIDENNNTIMEEASYSDYLTETKTRVSNTDETSGWMRFHTSVLEVDDTTGQATCAFTWLTPPPERFTDVVGLALAQGTVKMNTSEGFYRYVSPIESYHYDFTSADITEHGHGITCEVNLPASDYSYGTTDFIFLSTHFYKEGNSEGVVGTYAHKRLALALGLDFSIDRAGAISWSSSLSIVTYFTQESGYVSIEW